MVIAIMAALAALLLPAVRKAREVASQASCVSNQRQCAIAFISYAGAYNGSCPPSCAVNPFLMYKSLGHPAWDAYSTDTENRWWGWQTLILPFIGYDSPPAAGKVIDLYRCASLAYLPPPAVKYIATLNSRWAGTDPSQYPQVKQP